jgi:hypothetical protein
MTNPARSMPGEVLRRPRAQFAFKRGCLDNGMTQEKHAVRRPQIAEAATKRMLSIVIE